MNTNEQVQSSGKYSTKWQERFNFFDTYGSPSDPRYKAAIKTLPGLKKKMLIKSPTAHREAETAKAHRG